MKVIRIRFDKDLAKLMETLPEKMREIAYQVIHERAGVMVDIAKDLAPVDTGSLKKSIRRRRTSKGLQVTAGGYVANPKTGRLVDYAVHAEARQPFMRPAWSFAKHGIVEEIEQRVENEC